MEIRNSNNVSSKELVVPDIREFDKILTANRLWLGHVIVSTQDKSYMVTNQQVVFDLAEKVSKMKHSQKVDSMRFPPGSTSEPYTKLLIQTKDHVTYGGSIWNLSAGNVLDSNGYYWIVQDDLVTALDKATKDSRTTQLP